MQKWSKNDFLRGHQLLWTDLIPNCMQNILVMLSQSIAILIVTLLY